MDSDEPDNDFGLVFSGVIVPAADMSASVSFYGALGLEVSFRDGDRWTALKTGAATLSLAGGDQLPTSQSAELMFRVADARALYLLVNDWEGAELREGPHEWQIRLLDPNGNWVVLYSRKTADQS